MNLDEAYESMPDASEGLDEASESLFGLPWVLASQARASDNLARASKSPDKFFDYLVGSQTPN